MAAPKVPSMIGVPIPRREGPGRVTGSARFSADTDLPGALWAKVVRSPVPHARVLSIDTAAAMRVPGVKAIITANDLPDPTRKTGRARLKDITILARDTVRFIGDRVAVVAAETQDAAEEAALLVQVEYEELPAVFDSLDAMMPEAPLVHPDLESYQGYNPDVHQGHNVCGRQRLEHGNVGEGFAQADVIVERTYVTQLMHHGYLEPTACAARIGEDGRIHVWASNKNPYSLRADIAYSLGRSADEVVVEAPSIGADFGGKSGAPDAACLSLLAELTGRPVKQALTYAEDLTATTPRHPAHVWLKTGAKRDGTIVAHEGSIVFNSGAFGGYKPSQQGMPGEPVHTLHGPYEIPNVRLEGLSVYTNQVPGGYMRAPGQPQACFAVEAHLDLLARELGMDPYELRAKNVTRHETERPDVVAPEVLSRAAEAIGWNSPKPPNVGRGIAIGSRHTGAGEGSSDITVNPDGTITVVTAIPDNGPGGLTIVAQAAAEFFGLPIERINLVHGNTDSLPVDASSAGSRVTHIVTSCVTAAGAKVVKQLTPIAAEQLGGKEATWEKPGWSSADGRFVSLEDLATEMIRPGDERAHAQVTLNLKSSGGLGYCAQAVEVEVDPETGEVNIRKVVSVQDVGTIVNPLSHRGQVESQIVQGMGYALMEELATEEGRVTTTHLGDYKLPVIADIPEVEVIDIPSSGVGPFNTRSVGELITVPTAAAIAGAIMDAIGAEIARLPMTPERVLAAIEATHTPA